MFTHVHTCSFVGLVLAKVQIQLSGFKIQLSASFLGRWSCRLELEVLAGGGRLCAKKGDSMIKRQRSPVCARARVLLITKGIASRNKKLLGAPGLSTRS